MLNGLSGEARRTKTDWTFFNVHHWLLDIEKEGLALLVPQGGNKTVCILLIYNRIGLKRVEDF